MRSVASSGDRRRTLLTVVAACAYVGGTVAWIAINGLFLSRDRLFAWLLLGLLVLSLTDVRRWARGLIVDWLPLMAVLLFYDLSNGVREWMGITPHVWPQLDADQALGFGQVPTLRLQHALYDPGVAHWYDYGVWAVYLTHFFVTLLVAAALWRFAYPRFRRWRNLVVTLATLGFVTYVLFPAVPPWLAAYQGHLGPMYRIVGEIWPHVGFGPASALFETRSAFYNQVGAIPSLHAAYPLLLLLFFWGGARRWVRVLLVGYVLAMAFTLVYTGEHYVADILVGWVYAAATYGLVTAAERAWERRAERRRGYAAAPAPARAT